MLMIPDAPVAIEKPWGGSRLIPGRNQIGELFWLSDLTKQETCFMGRPLSEILHEEGESILGESLFAKTKGQLPVYLKEIEAQENLSVQVHPTDQMAQLVEKQAFGKTEAWYVLEAEEGAGLYLGLGKKVTSPEFFRAVEAKEDVSKLMRFVPVKPREIYVVPAGFVHAIGKGVRLLEPQQRSNTTYRIWDWNREPGGKPRELHLEQAARALNDDPDFNAEYSVARRESGDARYFSLQEIKCLRNGELRLPAAPSYRILCVISGEVQDSETQEKLDQGRRVALIPAGEQVRLSNIGEAVEARILLVEPKF